MLRLLTPPFACGVRFDVRRMFGKSGVTGDVIQTTVRAADTCEFDSWLLPTGAGRRHLLGTGVDTGL